MKAQDVTDIRIVARQILESPKGYYTAADYFYRSRNSDPEPDDATQKKP